MEKIDDGGQAHPGYVNGVGWSTGMSLRDWLAGQALIGLLAMVKDESATVWRRPDKCASFAYEYADAMLKERSKQPTTEK